MDKSDVGSPVVLADIGGTNTRVALADGVRLRSGSIAKYANADFAHLRDILVDYLTKQGIERADGVCIAAAGPVQNGVADMTNLDWKITADDLHRVTGARRISILNDLQAQGHALGVLSTEHVKTVVQGSGAGQGTRLVVGLGTGMNAAPVYDLGEGHTFVPPSECGHTSMPVTDAALAALAQFVAASGSGAHGFAGIEDVLAGRGITRIHSFVAKDGGDKSPADILSDLGRGDATARETAKIYVQILGQVLGDLALTHLPFGGIYLIGGVARAMVPSMRDFGLTENFRAKGRFSGFMEAFDVYIVEDDFAALAGCASQLATVKQNLG